MLYTVAEKEKKAQEIRNLVIDTFEQGRMGHIASSFSSVEIMIELFYGGVMRFRPENPDWDGRDRFALSKGHAALLYYTILGDLGYFDKELLKNYGKAGSFLGVHVDKHVPGVEVTSGSLGNAFGVAAGMALAAKKDQKNHLVFALLGDGECYEGSVWETAMHAVHYQLNNLVAIVDHNHMSCSGFIENNVTMGDLAEKWQAFGFDVIRVNGHDFCELGKAFERIRCRKGNKPVCIIADTVKAKGLDSVENTPLCHGYAPRTPDDFNRARKEVNGGQN